ncbi:xanthine dehydrogenase accessory protein XdhC [uncultured Roseovarius sp.]|uniref:xanthine dehydrogenase accessory protein XdhC n=1 Tax=Roseovarius sp. TaxID=1486281 RepID=UPI001D212A88|nr:xanthine dehydrogenase accessory protein XdhC [uncultured Roseovarius sp.]TNE37541.1 MAG: xanthine dehydrogenase accessory protein XdhC [Sphingomonadales bacterium]
MSLSTASLNDFFVAHPSVVRIVLTRVRGSSPRNEGTEMFVTSRSLWGTLGGGQLEYLAIDTARKMLRDGALQRDVDVPLGPEIGQCCGGRVEMRLKRMRGSDKRAAVNRALKADAALPHVYVMGAGHVGRALAKLFQHLPVKCILIDTRPEEIALNTAAVETRVSVLPEADIWNAPAGSAFIVLTHDHALDFLLTSAALEREDAVYVGMIGSATKRAKFRNWTHKHCDGQTIEHLNCPIGASGSRDKRPSVIAAFVAAEVIAELTSETAAFAPAGASEMPRAGIYPGREGKLV